MSDDNPPTARNRDSGWLESIMNSSLTAEQKDRLVQRGLDDEADKRRLDAEADKRRLHFNNQCVAHLANISLNNTQAACNAIGLFAPTRAAGLGLENEAANNYQVHVADHIATIVQDLNQATQTAFQTFQTIAARRAASRHASVASAGSAGLLTNGPTESAGLLTNGTSYPQASVPGAQSQTLEYAIRMEYICRAAVEMTRMELEADQKTIERAFEADIQAPDNDACAQRRYQAVRDARAERNRATHNKLQMLMNDAFDASNDGN